MEELVKMNYKGFEFKANPSEIKINSSARVSTHYVPNSAPVVGSYCRSPIVVSGKGSFFGDDALDKAQRFSAFLLSDAPDWLIAPGLCTIEAYLKSFEYTIDTLKNSVSYTFEFVEDCKNKKLFASCDYTVAKENENAFDIANRTGVTVDDIVTKNNLPSPFEITGGDRVVLK